MCTEEILQRKYNVYHLMYRVILWKAQKLKNLRHSLLDDPGKIENQLDEVKAGLQS